MLSPFIESLGIWAWFIAGVVLLLLEIVISGIFLFWFGLAALGVGVLALFFAAEWQMQWMVFAVLAVIIVYCWWRVSSRRAHEGEDTDEPLLNRRAERQIGRVFVLDEPIVQGAGRVRIDDTVWRVEGHDVMAGTPIRVIGVRGSALVVEPVQE